MLFLDIIDILCKNSQETYKYNVCKLHCCLLGVAEDGTYIYVMVLNTRS